MQVCGVQCSAGLSLKLVAISRVRHSMVKQPSTCAVVKFVFFFWLCVSVQVKLAAVVL